MPLQLTVNKEKLLVFTNNVHLITIHYITFSFSINYNYFNVVIFDYQGLIVQSVIMV
jgi:hypothetical protein